MKPLLLQTTCNKLSGLITFPGADAAKDNVYLLARKQFQVNSRLESAIIHLCAQARYILYVNGELLGQGPVIGSDLTSYYDSYEIADKLTEGTNFLALEIHYPGNHFRTCSPGIPGFQCGITADIDWQDDDWQICLDPSRIDDAKELTFQAGYTVYRDLRDVPDNWQRFADNYPGWTTAIIKEATVFKLLPRDIPPLTRDIVNPAKLVGSGTVPPETGDSRQADFAALIDAGAQTPDATVFKQDSGEITALADASGVFLTYDFAREVYGSIIVRLVAPAGTVLDIVHGEMLEDNRLDAYYPFGERRPRAKTTSDGLRFADRHILAEGTNDIEIRLQDRGFRFAQLIFRNHGKPITLKKFAVENRVYPVGNEGKFSSDNEYYNKLWQICRHTVCHCLGDHFIDCPWREQAFWINDFLVSNLYYFNLTSDPRLPRRSFDLAFDGFSKYGALPAVYPAGDPLFFPSMPALWVLTLYEYYLYSGDDQGRYELLPKMDALLTQYNEMGGDDGLIPNHETWWNFIDIGYMDAGVELKGYTAILNSLVAAAYKCAAELHSDEITSSAYSARSQAICAAMQLRLWDARNNRFRDSTEKGFGLETFSVHPHAVMICFDLMPEDNAKFAKVLTNPDAIPAEPYFQRFVMEALAKSGRHDLAEKTIESLWYEMVKSDSPTVWEIAVKGPKARGVAQSLCHAFSCAPLAYCARTIAGIVPLKPGFKEFSFQPTSIRIKNFSCSQPVPNGMIEVNKNDNSIELTVPEGTVAVLPEGTKLGPGKHAIKS